MESVSVEESSGKTLDSEHVTDLVQRISGMALFYGVQMQVTDGVCPMRVEPMPITLFPSVLPKTLLDKALVLQTRFQTLMYKVSLDHSFMYECLKDVLLVDTFTRDLWTIYESVREEGAAQEISIMLTRNDYMMERKQEKTNDLHLRQVEFNTFASGAGGVITAMNQVHRYSLSITGIPFTDEQLPDNQPTKGLARGLVKAWELYQKPGSVILFVVGRPELNTPDQRWLERDIHEHNKNITVLYKTFQQLKQQATLGDQKQLIVDGNEVAIVYYRYGYSPVHYATTKEFDLRLLIERSKAIKCPSVALHIAGCKKIQQVLAEKGVLERFTDDMNVVKSMRAVFVGQFILDPGAEGDTNMEKVFQIPQKYVLKPQREGGGNNLFGEEIPHFLKSIKDPSERTSWILMERIQAFQHKNRLIRNGLDPTSRNVVSELGIYGVHIGTLTEEVVNFESGYLLRTKPEEANEGGLFGGQSCLDSPFLV